LNHSKNLIFPLAIFLGAYSQTDSRWNCVLNIMYLNKRHSILPDTWVLSCPDFQPKNGATEGELKAFLGKYFSRWQIAGVDKLHPLTKKEIQAIESIPKQDRFSQDLDYVHRFAW